jgi:hypothetical protein
LAAKLGGSDEKADEILSNPDYESGFISSEGNFLSRQQAFDLARKIGQVSKKAVASMAARGEEGLNAESLHGHRQFMPETETKLPHSVPENELKLVHYGQPGMTETDPSKFGRSGITSRSELAGEPRSYFYEAGKENANDPSVNRKDKYSTLVSGASIYDGDKDALGYKKMVNRSAADQMLQSEGYSGIARTSADGKYRQVEIYHPHPVSPAKFMPAVKTSSPEFKDWFAGSKVTTKEGEPRKVYHGTATDFKKFDMKRMTQGLIWFTSDKSKVEHGEVGAAGHGHIMELYVSLKNPADWKQYGKLGLYEFPREGLDGAILPREDGEFDGFVFSPKQVRKAPKEKSSLSGQSVPKKRLAK